MLRTHNPLTSNSRRTSFRNGSSRCFKYRPSPIRRRCANLILSTRTARRSALTRAARNWSPFRRPPLTRVSNQPTGLARMTRPRILHIVYSVRRDGLSRNYHSPAIYPVDGLRVAMDRCPFFSCQRCKALYHAVEVAGARKIVTPRRGIVERRERCRLCGEPLPNGEGAPVLRYFLLPATEVTRVKRRSPA
jgi:hypothetical protein